MLPVIFDLDGTLIDSEPDIRAALNRVLSNYGLPPFPRGPVHKMIGDGTKVLIERGFAAHGMAPPDGALAAFVVDIEHNGANETVVYPGIKDMLAQLQAEGHPLAVCTNKPSQAARNVLAALGLEQFFAAVVGGDATPHRKPDPRHLSAVLNALGATRAVMVGDHFNDIAAADGLQLPSVFAAWGYGDARGTYTASKAEQLPGIIAAI